MLKVLKTKPKTQGQAKKHSLIFKGDKIRHILSPKFDTKYFGKKWKII